MEKNLRSAIAVLSRLFIITALTVNFAQADALQVTASSSESNLYGPANAMDGNHQSRWSSVFEDPQWLIVDLGEQKDVAGISIGWEAAFGKSYEVQLSDDKSSWKTVFETSESDGGTDEVYFRKAPARYIRIYMKERGTFWGYSILELSVKGADEEPAVTGSSTQQGSDPLNAFDGDRSTEWLNDSRSDAWIAIDLKKPKDIGGVQLNWGLNYAKSYDILTSDNGDSWKKVYSTEKGNGSKDLVYLDVTKARHIKISFRESNTGCGYSIKDISIKGADESATPQKHYELLAEEAPSGYYPKWLSKQQAFWTVAGIDGDDKESLLCEDGTIEPYWKSFSLMPYLYTGRGGLITSGNSEVTQSMEKGYLPLPSVTWEKDGIVFTQRLFASGERGKSASYAWYTIKNTTKEEVTGKFFLTVRPFQVNPPWQYGGLSEIRSLSCEDADMPAVKVNGAAAVISMSRPDAFGAVRYKQDDIVNVIESGKVPDERSVEDPDKLASGALEFAFGLKPGKKADYYFAIPLHEEVQGLPKKPGKAAAHFEKLLKGQKKYWEAKLDAFQIDVPDREIVDAMKANLGYILINKDLLKLQPGSRNYKKAWMRDGALISAAMLRMGYNDDVKEFLDWIAKRQYPNGMVPFMLEEGGMPGWARDWKEYDSQ
nr:discoidin domain-containing protein [Candidatus Omnitrophota bacterium]